jgi:alcohol dehydrogenase (cytochrome c)
MSERISILASNRACLSAVALGLLLSLVIVGPSAGQDEVTPSRIEQAAKEPQNWLSYYGNYAAWSYSPLDQITRMNVKQLVPVWAFATGELRGGLQSAPLVADGVMYLLGPHNRLFAINAATGKEVWHYYYKLPEGRSCGGTRGLAIGAGRAFFGTCDNHVVAVDAKTGQEVWNVEVEDYSKCHCYISSAPLFVKGKVIVGGTGGDNAHRGYLNAFDAETGKQVWRFWIIPGPGEPGNETWAGDSWKLGGGAPWLTGSYDPKLNLTYWGTGNASSTLYGSHRLGDNLYTASLVALDPDTGNLKWYFQETPHDIYDYDSAPEPVLIDIDRNGKRQELVVHPSKNGYAYVLDRATGKYLNGWPYVYDINWNKGLDKNGKPIDAVVLPPGQWTVFCPATSGGRAYEHSAYSPRTGWWYSIGWQFCARADPAEKEVNEGDFWFSGEREYRPSSNGTIWGHIDAFDPLTGKKQWSFRTDYLDVSSLLATGGDLLFTGDVWGGFFALDAKTGEKLWSFPTGSGITGAPISYSVNGRQYVAIGSGPGSGNYRQISSVWFPELAGRMPQAASTLFVFALPERVK